MSYIFSTLSIFTHVGRIRNDEHDWQNTLRNMAFHGEKNANILCCGEPSVFFPRHQTINTETSFKLHKVGSILPTHPERSG